jgi:YegS/Rv2252/BmrU family lipid kinase
MMKRVLLIVNPVAGKLRLHTELFDIIEVFCNNDCLVTTAITQYRGHGRELARDAEKNGYDLVVCCGGDGTLNEAMSGLLENTDRARIPLGYIPAGSTNDFADTLGIPAVPSAAAVNICKSDRVGIDVGKFNDERSFSYIATFGAFSAASYSASQELKNSIGHMAYLIEGLKQLGNMPRYHARVIADGKEYEDDYIYCSVSNTKSVGGLVKLSEKIVDLHDGLFEVILVKYPNDIGQTSRIVAGVLSSDFSNDMFEFFKAKDVTFTMAEGTAWSLDGERVDAPPTVNIRNLHRAIDIYL